MKIVTAIVSNTVPEKYFGVMMYNDYGIRLNFKKENNKLIFQTAIKMDFIKNEGNTKLFEFVTATNFEINKTIDDDGFFELLFSYMLTAIEDFDRHIKTNKSYLTLGKTYPKNISFENAKKNIRRTWFMQDFPSRSSN